MALAIGAEVDRNRGAGRTLLRCYPLVWSAMPLTLTFFAVAADGSERVLRQTTIPEAALIVYTSSPEIALRAAQTGGAPKPDGYRVTDDAGRVKAGLTDRRSWA